MSNPERLDALTSRFRELRRTGDRGLREQLIQAHLPLVRALARRFANRGEPVEDLISTGTVALINAVDRFDPEKGTRFSTFATPTILGELKRYFRDKSWAMKVPRRMQELNRAANHAREQLVQRLGRSPSYLEIASELGCDEEQVIEAMESGRGYDLVSFEGLGPTDDGPTHDGPGEEDEHLLNVVRRVEVAQAMESILDERERRIIAAYYFDEMSQTDIATREGISQMHVSRLLGRAKSKLRRYLQS
ncbi:MAG: SigB/SigF/SigG family RNA polymerase sigma factor [Fimbriimonadaceae bacterium]|nr:SigB/SigF/SigG family RNA polymerase sigma factor [Fimbriimonadaceae bacterium]